MVGVAFFAGLAIFLVASDTFAPLLGSTALAVRYGAVGVVFVGLAIASAHARRLRRIDRGTQELAALRAYALSVIVPQALREGLGLVGITAGLLTGSETWIVIFAAASLTSQFLGRPTMDDLEATLRTASASPGESPE